MFADELSMCGGFLFKGHRLVIPQPARKVVLEWLHRAHIGVNGILRRAREVAFYPGITTDIKWAAERCKICARHREETQKEPLLPHQPPLRPWEKVEVDIFTFVDIDYVITVDYLSGFFEVDRLPSKSVKDIIYHLRQHFCRHGLQLEVCTDNSPFGAREFKIDKLFAQRCDFLHVTSSPRYPQSNGRVENAVKTAKHLMKKATEAGEDVFLALLDWRNTPAEQLGQSPAQLLFNRRTRTSLPTASPLLDAATSSAANIALTAANANQAYYYNKGAKEKPPFAVGQTVRMKFDDKSEWWKGKVTDVLPYRSYNIKTEDGTVCRRNVSSIACTVPYYTIARYTRDSLIWHHAILLHIYLYSLAIYSLPCISAVRIVVFHFESNGIVFADSSCRKRR